MYDARIFLDTLDTARNKLIAEHATFKGEYIIHDAIYASKDLSQGIEKIFLRLRSVPNNIWNEKQYIVSIKVTELKEVGKQSIIPIKVQFDSKEEAQQYIEEHYSEQFDFLYEFSRTGWQYDLEENQIDLEDIEGYCSIEFKSPTEEGLQKLLTEFDAKNVIVGPSVVAVQNILKE